MDTHAMPEKRTAFAMRVARAAMLVTALAIVMYVVLFFALLISGIAIAKADGLNHAYYLADVATKDGMESHHYRKKFFSPLIYVVESLDGPWCAVKCDFTIVK